MGLFNFFKPKPKQDGIKHSKFNSTQFQNEVCALALWKLEDNNLKPDVAIDELKKVGLNEEQIDFVLDKVNSFLNKEGVRKHHVEGIDEIKFNSVNYQNEILDNAQKIYFQNNHNYKFVREQLIKNGLNSKQADEIVLKLEKRISELVNDFEEKLDSGVISEIKIQPNPEHKKGNVDNDQVDKYIGYGAYQMERGDLENALELFDKAIELNDKATLAYANKAGLYSLKGDNEKALFFIEKALDLEPHNKQILDSKVDIIFGLFNEKKIDESVFISGIKEILVKDSDNPNALIYVVQFYLKQNQIDDAVKSVINLFLNYHSENIVTHLLLDTFSRLGEEKAFEQFDLVERQVNEKAKYQLYYNKGLYLKTLKRYDEAIQLYDDLNKTHQFSWNYYQIGIMKNLQGKTDECIKYLKSTFDLEPGLKEDAKNFPELQNLFTNPKFIELVN